MLQNLRECQFKTNDRWRFLSSWTRSHDLPDVGRPISVHGEQSERIQEHIPFNSAQTSTMHEGFGTEITLRTTMPGGEGAHCVQLSSSRHKGLVRKGRKIKFPQNKVERQLATFGYMLASSWRSAKWSVLYFSKSFAPAVNQGGIPVPQ
ncbi:hypothetical protein PAPYR_10122 [Paratrimastix pyriformis]|uniref:Uncharacterized protein n=1 Tax=Paratrimastix pyriformis TaxID=342808 RepID=A0ABQ8UAF0_9EUKA|nr:hypothetical protein PAPYR_10122 [Paratrimastix pyriformis]